MNPNGPKGPAMMSLTSELRRIVATLKRWHASFTIDAFLPKLKAPPLLAHPPDESESRAMFVHYGVLVR